MSRHLVRQRVSIRAGLTGTLCGLAIATLGGGCATKSPPTGAEIRKQALGRIDLDHPWKATPAAATDVQDNWLGSFNDPELDALVREAIQNNPDLRVAATRVEQAQQYLVAAQAALRPWLGVAATGGAKAGGGGDVSSALQGAVLAASWELDLWGRLRYGRNAAQQSYASAQADFEFARQSIAANTAKAWFTATQLSLNAALAAEMVQSAQQLQGFAEDRERVGAGTKTETALARATVRSFEDTQQQVQFARSQALRALEILVGRYPGAEIAARADLVALPGPTPVGLPLQMLERRPDLVAAERRVDAAFNRVGEAKASYLPQITLNAKIGVFSSEVLQLKQDYSNPSGGAGARLLAPIYQGGALRAQVQVRTAEQKEAVADYARIALRALGDVENALAANQSLATRVNLLTEAVGDQTRALELTQQSAKVGRADQRTVEQQRLNVQSARIALLNTRTDQLAQRVNLHLALGGSFESPERKSTAQP
jgi:outer membrane protein, multidrug efflux system